jgi:hypothetical protein
MIVLAGMASLLKHIRWVSPEERQRRCHTSRNVSQQEMTRAAEAATQGPVLSPDGAHTTHCAASLPVETPCIGAECTSCSPAPSVPLPAQVPHPPVPQPPAACTESPLTAPRAVDACAPPVATAAAHTEHRSATTVKAPNPRRLKCTSPHHKLCDAEQSFVAQSARLKASALSYLYMTCTVDAKSFLAAASLAMQHGENLLCSSTATKLKLGVDPNKCMVPCKYCKIVQTLWAYKLELVQPVCAFAVCLL